MKTSHFDSRGMSLIEVSIALGIASVMSMAMVSLLQGQAREIQAMSDKMAALDFQRTVEGAISVPATCTQNVLVGNFVPGQPQTFDPNAITTTDKNNPQVLANLQKVYGGNNGLMVLADSTSSNRTVSPLSNNLKLKAGSGMQLAAYKDPTSNQLVYQLLLAFDSSTLVRPIHNLAMTINVDTAGSGSSTHIIGCTGASSSPAPTAKGTWCGAFNGNGIDYAGNFQMLSIISNCQEQTPTLSGTTTPFYEVNGITSYVVNSLCPSGYKLTRVGVASASTSAYTDPGSTGGLGVAGYATSTTGLYTCVGQ